jgi:ABC-2 type transport system permease protein
MTTTFVAAGRYRFSGVLRSEWTKLRSVRSVRWTLLAVVGATIGMAAAASSAQASGWSHRSLAYRARFDPTNWSLGLDFCTLAVGVLGALVVTGEFSSGTIRASLAAVPNRRLLLAAKAVVFGGIALLLGEVVTFATFLAVQMTLRSNSVPSATLAQPGVLRAVALSGAFLALLGLLGLGLGTIIRHSAGAVAVYVGIVLVLPGILAAFPGDSAKFSPEMLLASSVSAVRPHAHRLPPGWDGFALMGLYTLVALGVGRMLLSRRDA